MQFFEKMDATVEGVRLNDAAQQVRQILSKFVLAAVGGAIVGYAVGAPVIAVAGCPAHTDKEPPAVPASVSEHVVVLRVKAKAR